MGRRSLRTILCALVLFAPIHRLTLGAETYALHLSSQVEWPVFVNSRPSDSSLLFVGENLSGRISIIDPATHLLQGVFLDIDDLPTTIGAEQGLLGMAFDPNYATNGQFYVTYTAPNKDVVLKRYTASGNPLTSLVADPNSGETILRVPKAYGDHNGGWVGFGPDGYLYFTTGDGGGGFDNGPGHTPGIGNAQDLTDNLLGKVLRLDVRGDDFPTDPNRNYAVPATNPFVGAEGDDEIWAYGFRNPWRVSFDRATGDMWIGDVGQNGWEEINVIRANSAGGLNFGWRLREGPGAPDYVGGPAPPGAVEPVYSYPHLGSDNEPASKAVIGGFVYRGPVAAFGGHYLFGDFYGDLFDLDPDAVDPAASVIKITDRLLPDYGELNLVSGFGQDADGNVYITNLFGPYGGEVYKVMTRSKDAVWNGNSAASGNPGNGTTWVSANNWTRGGVVDTSFFAEDNVIFAAGSAVQQINLNDDQIVSAVTFAAPYTLINHKLHVISGNITVNSGVTATINSDLEADNEHRSLRKLGAGTLVINGHAGQTVVKEGLLRGKGSFDHLTIQSGGELRPGGPTFADRIGKITVDNSFTVESGGRLRMDIGGVNNSDSYVLQFDMLEIDGVAKLGGTLDVRLVNLGLGTFEPHLGNQFTLISADTIVGSFDSLSLPPLLTGLIWKPVISESTFSLEVALRTPGDYSGGGYVFAADYIIWRRNLGQLGTRLAADGSGANGVPDGIVDHYDYDLWRANYGTLPEDGDSAATVPEPASVALVTIILGHLALVRRRR